MNNKHRRFSTTAWFSALGVILTGLAVLLGAAYKI